MTRDEQAKRIRERLEALCADDAPAEVASGSWPSRMMSISAAIGFAAALGACYGAPTSPIEGPESAGAGSADPCAQCLESGGTWQPEANECTQSCDIADISCFEDSCPGACAATDCGNCLDQTVCEAAGCTWNIEAEAMWCN